jgi:hypothetical protein
VIPAVVNEHEEVMQINRQELAELIEYAVEKVGDDDTEDIIWVQLPEPVVLANGKVVSKLCIIELRSDGMGFIRCFQNRSTGSSGAVAVYGSCPALNNSIVRLLDTQHTESNCYKCRNAFKETGDCAHPEKGVCLANTTATAATSEVAALKIISSRMLNPKIQTDGLYLVTTIVCDADARVLPAIEDSQNTALGKLGMSAEAVAKLRETHPLKRRADLSHNNKTLKKNMLLVTKKSPEVTEAHINLILGVVVKHVEHLRDIIQVQRAECERQNKVFDVTKDTVVEREVSIVDTSLLNTVPHLNGLDKSHKKCVHGLCAIRTTLEDADYDSMPDGNEKNEFMQKVQDDYCKRKTTQAWVFVSRDQTEHEQVMHRFKFMKIAEGSKVLENMETLIRRLVNSGNILGAALAPGGTTMVENIWSLVAILTNGKRVYFSGLRNRFTIAASALRQRYGFQWLRVPRVLVGLPESHLSTTRADIKMARRAKDRKRMATAEFKESRAISKLARRMVNAQRARNADAYLGANRAELSMDRYNDAGATSRRASGKAKKCTTCQRTHGLMSVVCQQVTTTRGKYDVSRKATRASDSSMIDFVQGK